MVSQVVGSQIQQEAEKLRGLREVITFKDVSRDLAEIEGTVNALPGKLLSVRNGGYKYQNQLERQIERLASDWHFQLGQVRTEMMMHQNSLLAELNNIQGMYNRGVSTGAFITSFENRAEAAARSLEAAYASSKETSRKLKRRVEDIGWMLRQVAEASFQLDHSELLVEAISATWKKPENKEGINGILYLTDQRLIFERKEEAAAKKVLFITTARQKSQKFQWVAAVSDVERVAGSNRGFLGREDYLTITLASGAPFRTADIHLKGESGNTWRDYIKKVQNGTITRERVGREDRKEATSVLHY